MGFIVFFLLFFFLKGPSYNTETSGPSPSHAFPVSQALLVQGHFVRGP